MARKIPASLTKAYNRAIKRQGGASERAVKSALTEYIAENPEATVEELREYAIELLKSAGELYGNACSQAAFDLQDEIAREFATKPPDMSGWYYEPDAESIEKTAHYHAGKLVDGDVAGFVREMGSAARFYAERGANATMVETAKKQDRENRRSKRTGARTHGVTFARVPQGTTTCDFCIMLASRGFVYLTEESAGEFDRFHKNCDCRIVPGYPGMDLEGYDPDLYYDMWKHPEKYDSSTGETLEYGAVSGGYNDENDPYMEKRNAHAEMYYEEVRNRDTDIEVNAVSKNSGIDSSVVRNAYEHLFINEYELEGGKKRFDPLYDIAESWRRLREGKEIQEHDLLLLMHESYEYDLMKSGLGYEEAHAKAQEVYNYAQALKEYLKGGA